MVAAHVSELFGRSKPCMNALSVMMRCKWDVEISTRASSPDNLIDIHGNVVASIVHKAEPLEAHLVHAPVQKDDPTCPSGSLSAFASSSIFESDDIPCSECTCSSSKISSKSEKRKLFTYTVRETSAKSISSWSMEASDLTNLLMTDRYIGYSYGAQALLRSVLVEKHELCLSVVSLL